MKHFLLLLMVVIPFFTYSQLHETFTGPLITSDNPWEGNLDQFSITEEKELLFISPQDEAGEVSLSVPVVFSENMTWDIKVKLDFKSTTANNARIVVYETSTVSYYIQVGNNAGEISLYSLENGKATVRIKGRSVLSTEPYSYVSIRLTLKDNKDWRLYTCKTGETSFTQEADTYSKAVENVSKGKLTVLCRYIKSRISEFLFDDIHITSSIIPLPEVKPIDPDETSDLTLLDILPLSSNLLQFIFNKSVNIDDAIFSISDIGVAKEIVYGKDNTIVNANFLKQLQAGAEYKITIKNVRDLSGKILEEELWTVVFEDEEEETEETGQSSEIGALLINEVMADPKGLKELPETEYVELYNTTKSAIVLDGWAFFYDTKGVQLNGFSIPSKGYAILYRGGREIIVEETGQAIPLSSFPSALANTGKLLQVKDPTGKLIDEIFYPKATPAKSWERLADGEWHLSTDIKGGTPGIKNSEIKEDKGEEEENSEGENTEEAPDSGSVEVQPQEIIFNELLPNPYTGGSEFIELYNRSKRKQSLNGLSIATRKSDGTLSTKYSLASISSALESEGYALLTKEKEKVTDFYLATTPKNIHELKLPILANTTSTIVLFRTKDQKIIDEITYSNKWHSKSIKDEKGVSLERVSPDQKTQDPLNWTSAAATAGYATPGYKNSQSEKNEDVVLMTMEPPMLNESGVYSIKYYLDNPGYNCRAYVFNTGGMKVAEIANNNSLGVSGELLWNGNGLDGGVLGTGIYIFYAEVYSSNGIRKQYKKVFFVY